MFWGKQYSCQHLWNSRLKKLSIQNQTFFEWTNVVEIFWMQIFHEKVWACLDEHALKKSINYYYNV